ncbi:hypothetical protein [Rugosimonospora acidiphila]|uniref:hypothetical protein n=1 Tax=Rugosimonospora acidiphila TaxID=556531 RepID=UPI0031EF77AC
MERDELAGLLAAGQGEAYDACLQQLRRGSTFTIYQGVQPASHYERIYHHRDQHTHRMGISTVGVGETVDRLRSLGEEPMRLGSMTVAHPPYHYLFFLSVDFSAVVGCLGVDQRFQSTRDICPHAELACEAVAWAEDDFPGWIRVRLVDAAGRDWFFVDKVPIFTAGVITRETSFPVSVGIRCRILTAGPGRFDAGDLVVRTDVDGVNAEDGTNEFHVRRNQVV